MIVYNFGALKPTVGFDLMLKQLRLAHHYRNSLIELELWRRAALSFGVSVDDVKAQHALDCRAARALSGIGWGTYQLIEADVQRAKRTMTPRFRPFQGTGRLGASVQSCSKLTTDKLDGSGPVVLRSRERRTSIALRVLGEHVIELPIVLHRELPERAHVRRAVLTVDKIGTRWVYAVQLTLAVTGVSRVTGNGSVAINFGWRRVPTGVRVAYAVGDHGEHELFIPQRLVDRSRHAESLRGLADETAHKFLGDARRRSRQRREALVGAANRELGKIQFNPEKHTDREHWARRDRHLYQWECDERAGCLRARREIYRLWVRQLAARYSTVSIEDFDLKRLVERDSLAEIPEARHIRFLVAPSSLRQEVKLVFGDAAKVAPKARRTKKCHECGELCEWDRARELVHVCEHCGARWDQDANNSRNQHAEIAAE